MGKKVDDEHCDFEGGFAQKFQTLQRVLEATFQNNNRENLDLYLNTLHQIMAPINHSSAETRILIMHHLSGGRAPSKEKKS